MGYNITSEELDFLLTDEGQEKLSFLSSLDLSKINLINLIQKLSKETTPGRGRALVETAILRDRGKVKFPMAEKMYFLEEALEQASGEVVSRYRAGRFKGFKKGADLTCSIGGDLLSLADVLEHVVAVDLDNVRLKMAMANTCDCKAKIDFLNKDSRRKWDLDAAFIDPSRRKEGKRIFSLYKTSPNLLDIQELQKYIPHMGVKIMPGVDFEEIPAGCEVEFVSHDGTCKEAVLWFGDLRKHIPSGKTFSLSATVLPEGITLFNNGSEPVETTKPLSYIYEPEGSLIRAKMVEWLAWELEAKKLDKDIAYLTGDKLIKTPLARVWKVETFLPFSVKEINKTIRHMEIGNVVIKKRGTAVEPEDLKKRLKLPDCIGEATIFLTRVEGKQTAIICRDVEF